MIRQLVYAVKYICGFDHPGRNLTVFPDDTFIVSYPKSGNTWTRFLIANLAYPNERADFANINRIVPDPGALSKKYLKGLPRPRLLKSHEPFDPRYKKVIYIVRDPRDVALSEYHFDVKRNAIEEGYPIERYVARFVAGETGPYGSWGENVASWLATRQNNPNFLLVRYEDLQAQATHELARIASFLRIEVTEERLAEVVQRSSAEEMRKLEKKQAHLWSSTRETRKDKPFVRAAKSGGWKSELPEASITEIESAWNFLMRRLGYEQYVERRIKVGVDMVEKR